MERRNGGAVILVWFTNGSQSCLSQQNKIPNPKSLHEPTCVGDTAVLIASAGVVDDDHPNQRCAHNAAHHSYDDNSHGGPPIVVWSCTAHKAYSHTALPSRVTVGVRYDSQPDVPPLCAQRIGHLASVLPRISLCGVNNDEELVGGCEEVPLCHNQWAVVFGPVQFWGRAASSNALKDGSFTLGHSAVHEGPQEGRCFCKKSAMWDKEERAFHLCADAAMLKWDFLIPRCCLT